MVTGQLSAAQNKQLDMLKERELTKLKSKKDASEKRAKEKQETDQRNRA